MPRSISKLFLIILLVNSSCFHFNVSNKQSTASHKNTENFFFKSANLKKPTSWVNDYEYVLTQEQVNYLDSVCKSYEESTHNQIFIVTIASIGPFESLQRFTTELGNNWGVGQAEENNGLIITFSKYRREVWIGTGLGTEKILTDEVLQKIVDENMTPMFKNGEYFLGIKNGLEECIRNWN